MAPFRLFQLAALLGLTSHWAYFMHGEFHLAGLSIITAYLGLSLLLFVYLLEIDHYTPFDATATTFLVTSSYICALCTSVLLYRGFFHRLRHFPGPFVAKFSKLWYMSQLTNLDNFKHLVQYQGQYGDYVRLGPADLSVADPDAVQPVLGPASKCKKSEHYDAQLPLVSMHSTRDKAMHDKRRRVWDKALRNYEQRVKGYADMLIEKIRNSQGRSMNMAMWFNYYSFDLMGDLTFGRPFDMLKTGKDHECIKLLKDGMKPVGMLGQVPWLLAIAAKIPLASSGMHRFVAWCAEQAEERKNMKIDIPDLMTWILDSPSMGDEATNKHWLNGDSRLTIVAGSDTTAAGLTYAFYHLALEPSHVQKLRKEIDPLIADANFSTAALQNLDHLNGVINETLRLHPPVPSGLTRLTPPEGIHIGKHYIPGSVNVTIPFHVVQRSEKAYVLPNDFVPERWYSKPGMILHKDAYVPFSTGPMGCVGKHLALMELRTVISLLVTKFDVSFAPGEDGTRLLEDTKDCFTMALADLNLQFQTRT